MLVNWLTTFWPHQMQLDSKPPIPKRTKRWQSESTDLYKGAQEKIEKTKK